MDREHPPPERQQPDEVDLGRRRFFRTVGRNAVEAAGQMVGAADVLRRGTAAAADTFLHRGDAAGAADDPGAGGIGQVGRASRPSSAPSRTTSRIPGEPATYRSPYRLVDDGLIIVDQRELPAAIVELTCRDGKDVARAIGSGAVRGAPLLGQLAGYAMALTARQHRGRPPGSLDRELRSAEEALRRMWPTARPVHHALDRMAACRRALPVDVHPDVLSDALRAVADAIASEATMDHAALARNGAAALPRPDDRPLELLVHGETGAMGCGLVGTGLAVVQLLAAEGRPVHVWVTETGPGLEGARITAWELRQAGIAHTVIPDTAVPWLLQRHAPDTIILGAEWLTASGDSAVIAGGGGIAALAGTLADPPVPVLLCAPLMTFDPGTPDGAALPDEVRPPREPIGAGERRHQTASDTQAPVTDIAEARWLTAIVTEEGVLAPPFAPALRTALLAREARRAPAVAVPGLKDPRRAS